MKGLKAVKALVVVMIASLLLSAADGTNHSVGGAFGWDLSSDLQEWASQATFHVGDSLVFSYTRVHDVLEVNATDYGMCHTVNPLETYKDGETVIPLKEEGDRYFMCGRVGHCGMGLKLHVHVLPQLMIDSNATSSAPGSSPSASPSGDGSNPPPHATLFENLVLLCLGLCTLSTVLHPISTSGNVLMTGWDDQREPLEYIIALLSSMTWLIYDLVTDGGVIIAFKLLTISVEVSCIVVIVMHVGEHRRFRTCFLILGCNIVMPLLMIALCASSVNLIGCLAVSINLGVYLFPVLILKNLLEEGDNNHAEDVNFSNSCLRFTNCSLWILFAILEMDYFVAVPNIFGLSVAITELVVLRIYYQREDSSSESSLEEPLIGTSAD